MRPVLNPALRRVWRDATTLQIGLDPERAVVIGGLDPTCAQLVESLDGTRDVAGVLERAAALRMDRAHAERLLDLLRQSGVLGDAATDVSVLATLDRAQRDRLAPDLASLSLTHPDGGPAVLARRRAAAVCVRGLGRVGTLVCLLLSAAGVGRVVPRDPAVLQSADLTVASPPASAVGRRREDAVRESLAALAPGTRTASLKGRRPFDVIVVAGSGLPVLPELAEELVRDGVPHLFAVVRETTALLGPFVVPGRTACLRCQALHRADRDPLWPTIAAQVSGRSREAGEPACDTALATLLAAQAALHVLTFLDSAGAVLPPSADGTVETVLPDAVTRRRTWVPHPACGCQWPRAG